MKNTSFQTSLFYLIQEGLIEKKQEIVYVSNGKEIKESQSSLKKIRMKKAYVPIFLNEKLRLIVKDYPLNFFLAHCILIGERSSLRKISIEGYKEQFIITEEDLDTFPLDYFAEEECDTKSLYLQDFSFPFEELPLLKELKEEALESIKLDLHKLHFVKGEGVTLFLPTVHKKDFELAKKLQLPLFSLFDKHFLRSSTLHCYDFSKQERLLGALSYEEQEENWPCDKKENNILFRDLQEKLILKCDKLALQKRSEELQCSFFSFPDFFELELGSSQKSSFPFPLWTSVLHPLYTFKTQEECEELSGRPYKEDSSFFSSLYLQDEHGKKLHYLNFYLNSSLCPFLKELEEETLFFHSKEEFFFKFFFSKNLKKIEEQLSIKTQEEKELKRKSRFLLEFFFKFFADKKGIYTKNYELSSLTSKAFFHLCFECDLEKEQVKNSELLLSDALLFLRETLSLLYTSTKLISLEEDEAFYALQLFSKLLELLKELDEHLLLEEREEFFSSFKDLKVLLSKKILREEDLLFFKDLVDAKEHFKKNEEILVVLKDKKLNLASFAKDLPYTRKEIHSKSFLHPNVPFIQKRYPYVEKELLEVLKKKKEEDLFEVIFIKNRRIPISKEFFIEEKVYTNYHLLHKREGYEILLKKSNK